MFLSCYRRAIIRNQRKQQYKASNKNLPRYSPPYDPKHRFRLDFSHFRPQCIAQLPHRRPTQSSRASVPISLPRRSLTINHSLARRIIFSRRRVRGHARRTGRSRALRGRGGPRENNFTSERSHQFRSRAWPREFAKRSCARRPASLRVSAAGQKTWARIRRDITCRRTRRTYKRGRGQNVKQQEGERRESRRAKGSRIASDIFKMAFLTPYWGLDGIIILTSLMVAGYLYMTRKFKYWEKRGIMELPPTPIMGNFSDCILMRKSPSYFVKDLYDRSKGLPYMGFYVFDKPYFLARDPELVKHILVKDFNVFKDRNASPDEVHDRLGAANIFMMKNPAWKVVRAKLTPIFTTGKLKQMFELMLIVADDLEKHLESLNVGSNGKILEFKDLCANFTTDLIGITAFGLRVESLNNPKAPFRECGRKIFGYDFVRSFEFLIIFFVPDLVKYLRPHFFGRAAAKFLRTAFWGVINQRIETGTKRNDLIDLLIELKEKHKDDNLEGFKFDGDDLLAQAVVFFTGGFETSSTTMSFTLYELALNPEVQTTLRKEIRDALAETNGKLTYEMIMTLPYLHMVVSETLRKYPPLGFLDRIAGADYKVPNSDVTLEKGTPVYISMIGLHYDPEYFPDPEKYDPLRFTEEAKKSRPPFAYLPFGEGPHICIGLRLGYIQSKLGIVQVLKDYEVLPCDKTLIPMVITPKGFTTTPISGIHLNLRRATAD